jgi:S-adenosylmethionine-diacylgycerolhomoserine-N-methlytransferase
MGLAGELRILGSLLRGAHRGADHQERMENFYGAQAADYDRFRERLLHGRQEMLAALAPQPGERVAEYGGGTGRNLEWMDDAVVRSLANVEIIDLCRPLLEQARRRAAARGWSNITTIAHDVCEPLPEAGPLDCAWFSYSLTMIPDWFAAIDRAIERLEPGGRLGVVDFHLPRQHPAVGRRTMSGLGRWFWRTWFGHDGVYPSGDILAYLERRLDTLSLVEARGRVPYLPGLRMHHFRFVGRKRG